MDKCTQFTVVSKCVYIYFAWGRWQFSSENVAKYFMGTSSLLTFCTETFMMVEHVRNSPAKSITFQIKFIHRMAIATDSSSSIQLRQICLMTMNKLLLTIFIIVIIGTFECKHTVFFPFKRNNDNHKSIVKWMTRKKVVDKHHTKMGINHYGLMTKSTRRKNIFNCSY